LFAATHPERVTHLMLYGTFAVGAYVLRDEGEPHGTAWCERILPMFEDSVEHWGEGRSIDFLAAKVAHRPLERRLWASWERTGSSPGVIKHLLHGVLGLDVRAVLPAISAPTMVVHFRDDMAVPVWMGEQVAAAIPGARMVVLDGGDHIPFSLGDINRAADEVEAHITGVRPAAHPDRQLLTVVFTDIVASTERVVELGDNAWGDLVGRHDSVVRSLLVEHRGREIKTLGDGFLATFDGPGRAVAFARALCAQLDELDIAVKVGVHSGECDVTVDDIRGLAVNIASRVCSLAGPGEVLVTSTVRDLIVGSGVELADRGAHSLKGVPGEWTLAAVGERSQLAEPVLPTRTPAVRRSDRLLERVATRYPVMSRVGLRAARAVAR
jgi:class 3 adenylate cyclase